jgi:hypothetical protein
VTRRRSRVAAAPGEDDRPPHMPNTWPGEHASRRALARVAHSWVGSQPPTVTQAGRDASRGTPPRARRAAWLCGRSRRDGRLAAMPGGDPMPRGPCRRPAGQEPIPSAGRGARVPRRAIPAVGGWYRARNALVGSSIGASRFWMGIGRGLGEAGTPMPRPPMPT